MTIGNINLTIQFKWWVRLYITAVKYFCFIFRIEPDLEKMKDFIADKGVKYGTQTVACDNNLAESK